MRYSVSRVFCLIGLSLSLWVPAQSHAAPTWTSLSYPAASTTFAQAINSSGLIVGGYLTKDGTEQGFLYSGGEFATFNVPNAHDTVITGVNDNGVLAGYYSDQSLVFHSFLYDGLNFTFIDYPGAMAGTTVLSQVNSYGIAAGSYKSTDGVSHGFTYDDGLFTTIDVPGASNTWAYGIDSRGEVAGAYSIGTSGNTQGFVLSGGRYRIVTYSKAVSLSIRAINDSHEFVGLIGGTSGGTAGFKYLGGIQSMTYPGAYFTVAYGLNNAGVIVGYYIDRQTAVGHAFMRTP